MRIVLNDYFLRNSTARIIGMSYDQGIVAFHFWKWNLTFRSNRERLLTNDTFESGASGWTAE